MANCAKCSLPLDENAKFCASCGAAISVGQPVAAGSGTAASPAPQVTQLMVAKPKRGGLLALKGFILAFLIALISVGSTKNDSLQTTGMLIGFGLGGAYIVTNLRSWKRKNEVVAWAPVGWAVAICLSVLCFAGLCSLAGISSHDNSQARQPLRLAPPPALPLRLAPPQ